jgi:hypothetical protein
MDYGKLIREAWAITWRYRFLWILGVLAGGSGGIPTFGGSPGRTTVPGAQNDLNQMSPMLAATAEQVGAWAAVHAGLVIALGVVGVIVALALIVVSFIAEGGMAQATTELATGRSSSFGSAWSAGVRLFWRYLGLGVVLVLAAIAVAITVAFLLAIAFIIGTVGQTPAAGIAFGAAVWVAIVAVFVTFVVGKMPETTVPRWLVVAGATLFALPLFTVLLATGLAVSIVVAFAQRAIVVENVGPIAALWSGWRLMRAHLGDSLVTWLVNLGLALAAGIACLAGILGALVVLAGVGAVLFAAVGFSAPIVAYLGLGGVALLVAALALAGICNTFFWSYWTLAYLRLSTPSRNSAGVGAV